MLPQTGIYPRNSYLKGGYEWLFVTYFYVGGKVISLVACVNVGTESSILIFLQIAKYSLTQYIIIVIETIELVLCS